MMRARSAYAAGLSWFPDAPPLPPRASLGNATDDARQARADYFGQLANAGNVAAARILIGGTQNTSGNEAPMWQVWIDACKQTPIGLQTMQAAEYLGAWWPVGSSDTATNYPIMRAFVAAWAKDNLPPPPILATPQATPVPPVQAPTIAYPAGTAPALTPPPRATLTPLAPSYSPLSALAGGAVPQWAIVAGGALALAFVVRSLQASRR